MKLDLKIVGFSTNGGIGVYEGVNRDNNSTEFVVDTENFVGISSKAAFDVCCSSGLIPWSTSGVSQILSDDFIILDFSLDCCNWLFLFGVKDIFFGDNGCVLIGLLSFFVIISFLCFDDDWVITAFLWITDLDVGFPVSFPVNFYFRAILTSVL